MKHYTGFEWDAPYSWHSTMIWRGTPENGYFIYVPKPIAWIHRIYLDIYIQYLRLILWHKYRSPWAK